MLERLACSARRSISGFALDMFTALRICIAVSGSSNVRMAPVRATMEPHQGRPVCTCTPSSATASAPVGVLDADASAAVSNPCGAVSARALACLGGVCAHLPLCSAHAACFAILRMARGRSDFACCGSALEILDATQEAEIVHSLLGVKGESYAHSFRSSQILPAT